VGRRTRSCAGLIPTAQGDVGEETARTADRVGLSPPRDSSRATFSIGGIGTDISLHRTSNRLVDVASSFRDGGGADAAHPAEG